MLNDTLDRLHKVIKNKHPGMLWLGVNILHDNARPYVTQVYVEALKWEVLEHPAYSPDLSPCDYHIFGLPKKNLMGQQLHSNNYVRVAVLKWIRDQPRGRNSSSS
ncbi:uncharacterized protein TNCV_4568251 [Trichonephila clavipes]|nr:uncharacterized protein TNCV_4568251 [Trichonephila clavipes]